jgi:hypothetical protein
MSEIIDKVDQPTMIMREKVPDSLRRNKLDATIKKKNSLTIINLSFLKTSRPTKNDKLKRLG